MKKYNIIIFMLVFTTSFSQTDTKVYSYKNRFFSESIELKVNGKFKYNNQIHMGGRSEIEGNWQLRNDTILVLDSSPQRSKIIVKENLKKNKNVTFQVRDSKQDIIDYHLYVINDRQDTIVYRDQFDKSIIKEKPISFFLVNTIGLHSPIIKVTNSKVNYFDIIFEQKRVFENEYWKIHGDEIIPLGMNGQYVNYFLKEN